MNESETIEAETIERMHGMCQQSLSPDYFEKWELVKALLEITRNTDSYLCTKNQEFIEKWNVAFESEEQRLAINNEMLKDLNSIQMFQHNEKNSNESTPKITLKWGVSHSNGSVTVDLSELGCETEQEWLELRTSDREDRMQCAIDRFVVEPSIKIESYSLENINKQSNRTNDCWYSAKRTPESRSHN